MKSQYFIELKCIVEDYDGPIKLGETKYLSPQTIVGISEEFTDDIEDAWKTADFKMAKYVAKGIYKNGNFLPKIKEIYRNVGSEIYVDYDNC